ncbi:hypothetical protein DPM19_13075 [Actinomadura craniellae]|uniref:Tetratricopeptide repeat protein n=1 Tax=Actinomadura craniellae TaxID=2231787 RepID=A0A365H6L3_9ACTN|nr:tetratricopeptide repeat protein [Actinomadura craniellae]RAY14679.1 hypothetical protein DPM19_13075 [Actinomadura craniellae]
MTDVQPDEMMARIGRGVELGHAGEREAARRLLGGLWDELGEGGDPLHRCALAHYMADVQDDVREELRWDLRALAAADLVTDERAGQAGVAGSVRGFYPSLHLNLGDAYHRLGELDQARDHLERGRAAVDALGDDGYGQMIRAGLDRLADRLAPAREA